MAARQNPLLSPGGGSLLRRLGFARKWEEGPCFGAVTLREAAMDDFAEWAALRGASREFLTPWESTWPEDALTAAAFRRRLRQYTEDRERGVGYYFLIRRTADGVLVGGINLTHVRRGIAQSGTLGYWIGASFARRGYMTDAMRAVLAFAFDMLALNRVEAACLPANAASRALLARCGFTQEGLARKYLRINGVWQDHLTFAILREDWRARKEPA